MIYGRRKAFEEKFDLTRGKIERKFWLEENPNGELKTKLKEKFFHFGKKFQNGCVNEKFSFSSSFDDLKKKF